MSNLDKALKYIDDLYFKKQLSLEKAIQAGKAYLEAINKRTITK
jgi:hypothetical protein